MSTTCDPTPTAKIRHQRHSGNKSRTVSCGRKTWTTVMNTPCNHCFWTCINTKFQQVVHSVEPIMPGLSVKWKRKSMVLCGNTRALFRASEFLRKRMHADFSPTVLSRTWHGIWIGSLGSCNTPRPTPTRLDADSLLARATGMESRRCLSMVQVERLYGM
jgi:hypothetical protein